MAPPIKELGLFTPGIGPIEIFSDYINEQIVFLLVGSALSIATWKSRRYSLKKRQPDS